MLIFGQYQMFQLFGLWLVSVVTINTQGGVRTMVISTASHIYILWWPVSAKKQQIWKQHSETHQNGKVLIEHDMMFIVREQMSLNEATDTFYSCLLLCGGSLDSLLYSFNTSLRTLKTHLKEAGLFRKTNSTSFSFYSSCTLCPVSDEHVIFNKLITEKNLVPLKALLYSFSSQPAQMFTFSKTEA